MYSKIDFWANYQELNYDLEFLTEMYETSKDNMQKLVMDNFVFSSIVEKIKIMSNMGMKDSIMKKLYSLGMDVGSINNLLNTNVEWWN